MLFPPHLLFAQDLSKPFGSCVFTPSLHSHTTLICCLDWGEGGGTDRFVYRPTADVEKKLSTEISELKSDISNLNKKLHYLETTHKNSRNHIDQFLNSGRKS